MWQVRSPPTDGSSTGKRIPSSFSRAFFRTVRSKHAVPLAVAFSLTLPLFVATAVLYSEPWAPLYDTALVEQMVRDVGTGRTPLLGLGGRLGPPERPASHPGPLSFYMLAPVHRLLGGSAWGLQVSAAFLNAVALTAAVF